MLHDVIPLREYRFDTVSSRYIQRALSYIGDILGIELFIQSGAHTSEITRLIRNLKDAGVFSSIQSSPSSFGDEPPMVTVTTRDLEGKSVSGGLSTNSPERATYAALGEALERHIWEHELDYTKNKTEASYLEMDPARTLNPETCVGLSKAWRESNAAHHVRLDTKLVWHEGYSLTKKTPYYLPLQLISKKHTVTSTEPRIYVPTTTGLATAQTKNEARLRGILEVLERDAFMIMWMNQLTLSRIEPNSFVTKDGTLDTLMRRCAQYRLNVHFVYLMTDAPTHAILAVVCDAITHENPMPHTTIGTSAGKDIEKTAEKALLEALRGRKNARSRLEKNPSLLTKKPLEIRHTERGVYWCAPERKKLLEFLYAGDMKPAPRASWEQDDDDAYLERIIEWARQNEITIISSSLGTSSKNPTDWHVEFVTIPQLQPMHQNEAVRYTHGHRLHDIPNRYDVKPLFTHPTEPHPFV